jgi:small subunit ribosomal protein S17
MNNGSSVQRQLRTREGVVVNRGLDRARMDKTVVVQVTRLTRHPRYQRVLRRSTKYHAHDEHNECRVGDRVRIAECRPLSKTKCWRVVEIVSRAQ